MIDCRFPHHAHIRTPSDFSRCFASGKRASGRYFLCVFRAADDDDEVAQAAGLRLGMAVSRKVDGRAVERNRLRRLIREWFRHRRQEFLSGDLVVVGKPAARGVEAADLFSDLDGITRRLRIEANPGSRHNAGSIATGDAPQHTSYRAGNP